MSERPALKRHKGMEHETVAMRILGWRPEKVAWVKNAPDGGVFYVYPGERPNSDVGSVVAPVPPLPPPPPPPKAPEWECNWCEKIVQSKELPEKWQSETPTTCGCGVQEPLCDECHQRYLNDEMMEYMGRCDWCSR